jgi:hypothetical protein
MLIARQCTMDLPTVLAPPGRCGGLLRRLATSIVFCLPHGVRPLLVAAGSFFEVVKVMIAVEPAVLFQPALAPTGLRAGFGQRRPVGAALTLRAEPELAHHGGSVRKRDLIRHAPTRPGPAWTRASQPKEE